MKAFMWITLAFCAVCLVWGTQMWVSAKSDCDTKGGVMVDDPVWGYDCVEPKR